MLTPELRIARAFVKPILENPTANGRKWQVQGLGMLRTYLEPDLRLHVWNSKMRYCADSGHHTHPWDFWSYIVAGRIADHGFIQHVLEGPITERMLGPDRWMPYNKQKIICGPGGCSVSEIEKTFLWPTDDLVYAAGMKYGHRADDIHWTETTDGAVSIISRKTVHEDGSAYIFWPEGKEFTSAEARPATPEEIALGTSTALAQIIREEQQP
jgi:hypothetical protein